MTSSGPIVPTRDCVVVATDGSRDARRALQQAAEVAFLERRSLVVVSVTGLAQAPAATMVGLAASYVPTVVELREQAQATADEGLALVTQLRPGLPATSSVLIGDPRRVLVELTRSAHLLVVGSRGRGAIRSRVLGSVSSAVSREAACPVLVCRPHPRGTAPTSGVLVRVDGSPESQPVLQFALEHASLCGLRLIVVPSHPEDLPRRLALAEIVAAMGTTFPEVLVDLCDAPGQGNGGPALDSSDWHLIVVGQPDAAVVAHTHTTVAVVPQPVTQRP